MRETANNRRSVMRLLKRFGRGPLKEVRAVAKTLSEKGPEVWELIEHPARVCGINPDLMSAADEVLRWLTGLNDRGAVAMPGLAAALGYTSIFANPRRTKDTIRLLLAMGPFAYTASPFVFRAVAANPLPYDLASVYATSRPKLDVDNQYTFDSFRLLLDAAESDHLERSHAARCLLKATEVISQDESKLASIVERFTHAKPETQRSLVGVFFNSECFTCDILYPVLEVASQTIQDPKNAVEFRHAAMSLLWQYTRYDPEIIEELSLDTTLRVLVDAEEKTPIRVFEGSLEILRRTDYAETTAKKILNNASRLSEAYERAAIFFAHRVLFSFDLQLGFRPERSLDWDDAAKRRASNLIVESALRLRHGPHDPWMTMRTSLLQNHLDVVKRQPILPLLQLADDLSHRNRYAEKPESKWSDQPAHAATVKRLMEALDGLTFAIISNRSESLIKKGVSSIWMADKRVATLQDFGAARLALAAAIGSQTETGSNVLELLESSPIRSEFLPIARKSFKSAPNLFIRYGYEDAAHYYTSLLVHLLASGVPDNWKSMVLNGKPIEGTDLIRFLSKVIKSRTIDLYRQAKRKSRSIPECDLPSAPTAHNSSRLELAELSMTREEAAEFLPYAKELHGQLQAYLNSLDELSAKAFFLRYEHGKSGEEISKILGWSESKVATQNTKNWREFRESSDFRDYMPPKLSPSDSFISRLNAILQDS